MAKKKIGYGDFFCWNCGERMEKKTDRCPLCGASYEGEGKYGNIQALGAGGIGWSEDINHPSLQAYGKKMNKTVFIFYGAMIIIIPTVLLLTGQIQLDSEGKYVIGGLTVIFTLFGLFILIGMRKKKPDWDGVVEDKKISQQVKKIRDDDGHTYKQQYTEYAIYIRKNNGQIFKLAYEDYPVKYDYYRIGDYVHYHGGKNLSYYEKYDKSLDSYLFCAGCGDARDTRDNFCGKCGTKLLKGTIE